MHFFKLSTTQYLDKLNYSYDQSKNLMYHNSYGDKLKINKLNTKTLITIENLVIARRITI